MTTTARARVADPAETYDVAVVGGQLAPSLLAAVLARNSMNVLLIDGPSSADRAAGETTVPYTAEVFFTLAARFGLPELRGFGLAETLPERVRRSSGAKGNIGFVYHRPGREPRPEETVQFNVPGEHSEWHPYRPEVDEYAHEIAVARGAAVIARRPAATGVAVGPDGVAVTAADGRTYRAGYLVDGVGLLAVAGATGDHRAEGPVGLRHRGTVLTTRMYGVAPFEDCVRGGEAADPWSKGNSDPWSKGTLSHLFDGGWMQVVPFGNHPSAANPRCGVTISVDPERFPWWTGDPDVDVQRLFERYPAIGRQFEQAVAAEPWTVAPRRPWRATETCGERWFVFDRAASRTDLFLSRDLTMSAEMVHALAADLLAAAARGEAPGRLERAARFQRDLIDFHDRMLVAARTATRDFPLWNAFSRVWLLQSMLAALALKSARNAAIRAAGPNAGPNADVWRAVERFTDGAFWFPVPAGLADLLERTFARCAEVEAGERGPTTAAARVFGDLGAAPFVPPLYRFADPAARRYRFSRAARFRMLLWARTRAPREFRTMLTRENLTAAVPVAAPSRPE